MAIDPNIKKKANDIRNKVYGKEVRESLASGLEEMSSDVVETVGRQDEVEGQWQNVVDETTGKDVISAPEIIAARDGEANLKARLDKEHQKVTAQLAHKAKEKSLKVIIENEEYSEVTLGHTLQHLTDDGKIYAVKHYTNPVVSTDNGKTYEHLPFEPDGVMTVVKELNDGRVLVSTKGTGATGAVYVSNHEHTAFTKVLTLSEGSFVTGWGFSQHENIITLGEYGGQGFAQKTYLSTDGGSSFRTILDLAEVATVPGNAHVHGVIYDKYWDRIWVMQGDGFASDENIKIFYSDDLGDTWDSFTPQAQMLSAYAFPERVIFTTDAGPNGIFIYERGSKSETPHVKLVHLYEGRGVGGVAYLPSGLQRRNESEPLIIPLQHGDAPQEDASKPNITLGTYDGLNYFEIWKDEYGHKRGGSMSAVGPTDDGKFLSMFSGGGRYENANTQLKADWRVEETNPVSNKPTDNTFLITKELGLTGDYVESDAFMVAIQTASRLGKKLHVPADQTILVERTIVKDLNNVNLDVQGTIRVIQNSSGAYADALTFINSSNIYINRLEIDSNNRVGIGASLHNALYFDNCQNIEVDKVIVKNLAGSGIRIESSARININDVEISGNNSGSGTEAFRVVDSEDIFVNKMKFDDASGIESLNSAIDISAINGTTRNIHINSFTMNDSGNGGIRVTKEEGRTLENITLKGVINKKEAYDGYEDIVIINGVNGLTLDIAIKTAHDDMSVSPSNIAGASINAVTDFDINVNIMNVYKGLELGNKTKLQNGKIKGTIFNIYAHGVLLGELENVDFELETDKVNEGKTNVANIQSSDSTPLTNVKFKDSYFGKGQTTYPCIDLYQKDLINVLFVDNDFTEWEQSKQLNHEKAGIKRINNLGMNWYSNPPGYYQGHWTVGEVIYNTNPTAGGNLGWVCTSPGRPGTWKAFGTIEA